MWYVVLSVAFAIILGIVIRHMREKIRQQELLADYWKIEYERKDKELSDLLFHECTSKKCGYCHKPEPYLCWRDGVCQACAERIGNQLRGGIALPWSS